MARRHDDHHLLLQHREDLQVGRDDGQGEQPQVHLVVAQQAQDRLRCARGDAEVDLPVEVAELLQQPGQDEQAHRHPPADVELAAVELARLRDLPQGILHVPLDPVGQLQEQLAGGGEGDAAALAMQEQAAQLLLEELDLAADRGLGDVEALGGPREAALLRHRAEHLQLAHVHQLFLFKIVLISNAHIQDISLCHGDHANIELHLYHDPFHTGSPWGMVRAASGARLLRASTPGSRARGSSLRSDHIRPGAATRPRQMSGGEFTSPPRKTLGGGLGGAPLAPRPQLQAPSGAGFTPAERGGGLGGAPLAPPSFNTTLVEWASSPSWRDGRPPACSPSPSPPSTGSPTGARWTRTGAPGTEPESRRRSRTTCCGPSWRPAASAGWRRGTSPSGSSSSRRTAPPRRTPG